MGSKEENAPIPVARETMKEPRHPRQTLEKRQSRCKVRSMAIRQAARNRRVVGSLGNS
jgi:hypothetical protein